MKIRESLLPINPFSRSGKKLYEVKGLVFHWAGNPGTSADGNRIYFGLLANQNITDDVEDRYASSHFIVDDNAIIQCIPDNEKAWHVGSYKYRAGIEAEIGKHPNNYLIGIEICHPDNSGNFTKRTILNVIELTFYLLNKYPHLKKKDLYRHYDITGKDCPKYWVSRPNYWEDFRNLIDSGLKLRS